ncbi:transcriptional attenuator, LytR family [Eubacterium uniforme]|uniref:Transcriptional attenuator, LytR family n=2 Tax=Eubacterium uniforme TaxID=39495 RepID=A0A1T4VH72_9FIRM|nr:transcriptional attenuator, LytR family [Eubacterium uniforme]
MNKKNIKVVCGIILAVLVVGAFAGIIYFFEKESDKANAKSISKQTEQTTEDTNKDNPGGLTNYVEIGDTLYKYTDDVESYLVIGTDNSGNENVKDESYRGTMADFLLLLVINKTKNEYGYIQFNRDTICDVKEVDSTGEGEGMEELQLCTAHWYGKDKEQSCENTVNSVSLLLGELDINGYYSVSMKDISSINHLVDGVEVKIEDDLTKEDAALKEGSVVKLTDEQAEKYIRARMGVGDGDNISRMRRQRTYMSAYFDKAKAMFNDNPKFINEAYKDMTDKAVTDINGNEASKIANMLSKMTSKGIFTFDGESKLGKKLGDGLEHAEFYVDKSSIIEVLKTLYCLEIDN